MRHRIALILCAAAGLTIGVAAASGDNGKSSSVKSCQDAGWMSLYRLDSTPFANQHECISYAAKGGALTSAHLVLNHTDIYPCYGLMHPGPTCWGLLQADSGLAPNAAVSVYTDAGLYQLEYADSNGDYVSTLLLICGANYTGVYASSTDAQGHTITTVPVNSPCG
jgi:hypothetical protein